VLEHLMTLVSELVLTRNQLLQLARSQQQDTFTVPLQRLSQITSDLQEGVMKTRMQPIGNAWNKLPRLVRDLSHELGKKIELIMRGAETELDRQVLELIKDPLTHMVRNSGDHGLETPAERRAAGKPETGHITLTAYHEGGHIIIEIGDDGRGLPVDRIRAKVLSQGLASEAEIAGMSDNEIQRFIFRAGFSTAASITAVSGRGVGMDVVKTNIEKIGGAIGLKSTPGAGTVFTIKIPLTLAIVSALIVESAGERFAIPQISVVELVRAGEAAGPARKTADAQRLHGKAASGAHAEASPGQTTHEEAAQAAVERINDTPVLRLRDRLLPLVNLRDLLRLDAAPGEVPAQDTATLRAAVHIVVTQMGAATLGIIVDRVFDTEEIVVKPVAPILRDITMFSGNTILGDGSVIMILDPNGIARASGMSGGESRGQNAAPAETASSSDSIAVLLFRAGDAAPKAVPLALVARLEDIPRARIETAGGRLVTQYRGQLMPLESMGSEMAEGASQPVLVFNDRGRSMGLMVDEIVDVVESPLHMELAAARPGILGTAVIAGHASDVIDTGYWLLQAFGDWFRDGGAGGGDAPHAGRQPHILVVDDSDFFRHLLVPVLSAAGYRVSAAGDAGRALALRDAGEQFDAIISDIEMPEMDGLAFARAVRAEPSWAAVPLIALSGRANPADVAAGHAAGFTDYVAKFDRAALLESLRQCFAPA
jgi:two-component system chemotaxis sensor kinase CheA